MQQDGDFMKGADGLQYAQCPECVEHRQGLDKTGIFAQCEKCSRGEILECPLWLFRLLEVDELPYRIYQSPGVSRVYMISLLGDQAGTNKVAENLRRVGECIVAQRLAMEEDKISLRNMLLVLNLDVHVDDQTFGKSTHFLNCDMCQKALPNQVWTESDVPRCDSCFERYSVGFDRDSDFLMRHFHLPGWRNVRDDNGSLEASLALDCIPHDVMSKMKRTARYQLESAESQERALQLKLLQLGEAAKSFELCGLEFKAL